MISGFCLEWLCKVLLYNKRESVLGGERVLFSTIPDTSGRGIALSS